MDQSEGQIWHTSDMGQIQPFDWPIPIYLQCDWLRTKQVTFTTRGAVSTLSNGHLVFLPSC